MQAAWHHSHCCFGHFWASQTFPFGVISYAFALQAHYPERLSMLWMYEAPTIFWGLWQVSPAAVSCQCMSRCVHSFWCLSQALLISP